MNKLKVTFIAVAAISFTMFISCDNARNKSTVGPEVPTQDSLSYYLEKSKEDVPMMKFFAAVLSVQKGIKSDSTKAIELLKEAVEKGYSPSERALAQSYLDSTSRFFDPIKGIELYQKAAEHGHVRAMLELANYYYQGLYVNRDYEKALSLSNEGLNKLFQLAQNNDRRAQMFLGQYFSSGAFLPQSEKEANTWLKKSAEAGCPEGEYSYGLMLLSKQNADTNYEEAIHWLNLAYEHKCDNAAATLAELYRQGFGVEQDLKKAFELNLEEAKRYNTVAMFRVAYSYGAGEGVEQDYTESFNWYKRLADRGDAGAQNNIGVMYENGQGVAKDLKEAFKWYFKAAKGGDTLAEANVAKCYLTGEGVEKDLTTAFEWAMKSANHGNAAGCRLVAWCYSTGNGVARDISKANYWADRGNVR